MKVHRSIDIVAPPRKVWPFLSEPEKILDWYIPLKKFEYTSKQRNKVGTPFYFEEKTTAGLLKLDCIIKEWEENEKFSFKMTSGNMMKNYEERWILKATPQGSRFTFMEQGEIGLFIIGKLIDPIAQRSSAAIIEKMLAKLKNLAEA